MCALCLQCHHNADQVSMIAKYFASFGFKSVYTFYVYKHGLSLHLFRNLFLDATDVGGPNFIPTIEWMSVGVREVYGRAAQPIPRYITVYIFLDLV